MVGFLWDWRAITSFSELRSGKPDLKPNLSILFLYIAQIIKLGHENLIQFKNRVTNDTDYHDKD